MTAIHQAATLAEIVLQDPRTAALFERLGLDYCCGGRDTLEHACARRGLDAATVRVLLDALADGPDDAAAEPHDVRRATIGELCEHIVLRHHDPLRADLPRIAHLLATVVRVHGRSHRDLVDLERLFASLRDDLEQHMRREEDALFPACRALERTEGPVAVFGDDLLELLEDDHAATGDALCALRELAGGYRTGGALCSTHRALLDSLRAFELDLHQHVHEENNVLFPRVRERLAAG